MALPHKLDNFAQTNPGMKWAAKLDPVLTGTAFKANHKVNEYLFPTPPVPPPEIAPPSIDQRAIDREMQDIARRRKGYAGTVVTGNSQAPSSNVSVTNLLGGG